MDLDRVRADIQAVCAGLAASAKIRVEVGATGTVQVEAGPLNPWAEPAKQVILSPERTRSQDPVYRYKTTNRALYDREFARARAMPGVYDVLFLNEHAHLTEAATHSVVLDMGGWYLTPALESGVLDGVGRALFLEAHAGKTVERSVTLDDVLAARRILLVSSMRGVNEVTLAEPVRRAA
jgi:para-aminobenzoate synthetase/4-amino-4-deoxychorismate lyase